MLDIFSVSSMLPTALKTLCPREKQLITTQVYNRHAKAQKHTWTNSC